MKTGQQSGFTLIELMIVVAIIGILAAIALPQYQDYTKRTYVGEGLSLANSAKTAVTEFFSVNNRWPSSNGSVGLPSSVSIKSSGGDPVQSVSVGANGVVTVNFGSKVLANATITLTPADNGGSIAWTCKNGSTMQAKWVPTNCR